MLFPLFPREAFSLGPVDTSTRKWNNGNNVYARLPKQIDGDPALFRRGAAPKVSDTRLLRSFHPRSEQLKATAARALP